MKKDEVNLLSALVVAAQCEGGPVTYLILSLRLNGFGGDRVCRGLIDQMKRGSLIDIDQSEDRPDRRTKTVRLTRSGWEAIHRFVGLVNSVVSDRPGGGAIMRGSKDVISLDSRLR
ncbi:MAG: hypothetical protein EBT79_10860 [Actinobacteria bacterium]|nr:hypothetical protein [Actinomycetota bacterium]